VLVLLFVIPPHPPPSHPILVRLDLPYTRDVFINPVCISPIERVEREREGGRGNRESRGGQGRGREKKKKKKNTTRGSIFFFFSRSLPTNPHTTDSLLLTPPSIPITPPFTSTTHLPGPWCRRQTCRRGDRSPGAPWRARCRRQRRRRSPCSCRRARPWWRRRPS
jgi:hypothetical protein